MKRLLKQVLFYPAVLCFAAAIAAAVFCFMTNPVPQTAAKYAKALKKSDAAAVAACMNMEMTDTESQAVTGLGELLGTSDVIQEVLPGPEQKSADGTRKVTVFLRAYAMGQSYMTSEQFTIKQANGKDYLSADSGFNLGF